MPRGHSYSMANSFDDIAIDLQVQVYEAPGSGATERDLSNWFAGLKAEIGCFGEICIFLFPYIKIATMRCK